MKNIIGKVAIAGNPNSGKTTFFNMLSGKNERVGNWAGVTVVKKEAWLKRRFNFLHGDILVVDLPGCYSLDAYTNDELEATKFIENEDIDVIINVVDSSNLERSLHLTEELINTGVPVIMALNKSDIIKRKRTQIDTKKLGELMGCEVVVTQATKRSGVMKVAWKVSELIWKNLKKKGKSEPYGEQQEEFKRHRKRSRNKKCRCE